MAERLTPRQVSLATEAAASETRRITLVVDAYSMVNFIYRGQDWIRGGEWGSGMCVWGDMSFFFNQSHHDGAPKQGAIMLLQIFQHAHTQCWAP